MGHGVSLDEPTEGQYEPTVQLVHAAALETIRAKLAADGNAACLDRYDEVSRVRILRGMFTNNKGTRDERIGECVSTFERVFKWKQANGLNESSYFASSSAALVAFATSPGLRLEANLPPSQAVQVSSELAPKASE